MLEGKRREKRLDEANEDPYYRDAMHIHFGFFKSEAPEVNALVKRLIEVTDIDTVEQILFDNGTSKDINRD